MVNLFNAPVFFVALRETIETGIIVSVLLAFIKQTLGHDQDPVTYKKLVRQVWYGVALGVVCCLCIGAGFIGAFYAAGKDSWATTEAIWEGSFALVASIIISIIGAGLLRVSKLKAKWQVKLARAIESNSSIEKGTIGSRFKRWCVKYAMFQLTFITVLREGLEAVIFVAGIGLSEPASSFPLAVVSGLAAGFLIGWFIYKGGNIASVQIFLIASTCFLYLVAAGLLSRAVWLFEQNEVDTEDLGPSLNGGGGWGIFYALFGWQNSATYGSVISYNLYWVVVIAVFLLMKYHEKNGHFPFMKLKAVAAEGKTRSGSSDDESGITYPEKAADSNRVLTKVEIV
ncbi:MAG: hypothetical protein Q9217_001563 [Psora testacea]